MRLKTRFILLFSLFWLLGCLQQEEEAKKAPPPPPEIPVIVTKGQDVPLYQEFVGQVFGAKDIAIRARVEGFLNEIHFQEGSHVKAGDLLYTLESQPFEADVAAQMSQVAAAKTMLAKATSDLKRIRPLAKQRAVSQSDLDAAVAQYEASKASVEAAEANLRASKIQLGYTKIYSPLDGIIGKTKARVGDFVGRSPNPVILNTVSEIETMLVQFFITESQYLQASRRLLELEKEAIEPQASPEANLELILADGTTYEHKGRFDFIDRGIDPTTGAILLQASFPNPEGLLRPGQFGKIKARTEVVKDGILIPQRCVVELQGQFKVYIVNENDTVEERDVSMGAKVKSAWLVLKGLEAGEKVVYEGLQRIGDGTSVKPIVQDMTITITEDM
jgi:membrane fusion protein (multidrug efflux system)